MTLLNRAGWLAVFFIWLACAVVASPIIIDRLAYLARAFGV